jgi:hypothetical protein
MGSNPLALVSPPDLLSAVTAVDVLCADTVHEEDLAMHASAEYISPSPDARPAQYTMHNRKVSEVKRSAIVNDQVPKPHCRQ